MDELRFFSDITAEDLEQVGGKGLSLGLMAAAGLPVPPGFCVTSEAYRDAEGSLRPPLIDRLASAYAELGRGLVAVRSSATSEDGAVTSFAGQQETILGVEGEESLKVAVERCWRSLHTDRAKAYRLKQGVDEAGLAMAVVVQRLVSADVAGVLFTRDPNDETGERMLIEASWGLGESVVSGKVTPDSFQVLRSTGEVKTRRLGAKHLRITARGEEAVSAESQQKFCLTDAQLAELAELGRRVEHFYGEERDVEWAWADGQFWLLQARPITTASAVDREKVRRAEIEKLRCLADRRGTVWSRYNLVEVLPEPTPMTWGVVQRLLSGNGGAGLMHRDLGFNPSPLLDNCTVYDLVGGRPYCNLSREPFLQAKKPQVDYPFALYKTSPLLALAPEPDPKSMYRGLRRKLSLPFFFWRQIRFAQRIGRLSKTFADDFQKRIVPAFVADLDNMTADDLRGLDSPALVARFEMLVQRTLVDFARDSLKPTLLAQFEMQVVEQQIKRHLGVDGARAAVAELVKGVHPEPEADFSAAIREMAAGRLDRGEFLRRFGHRGNQEMELAQPRWAEDSSSLDRLAHPQGRGAEPIVEREPINERWKKIASEAKLNSIMANWLLSNIERLRRYLGLREAAKHYLMRGYAHIRQTLLELDRRCKLQGGIFYLQPEELPGLLQGKDPHGIIDTRRKYRALALSLEVPPVLFSDDLEAIGRAVPAPTGATSLHGTALSAGIAEGVALVLSEPSEATLEEGYILVCPSTDPAWVPLFVQAKGLVMESGGALSHGAIVAREFGLPAVAGLPGVHRQLRTGQRLRVDGSRGTVTVID